MSEEMRKDIAGLKADTAELKTVTRNLAAALSGLPQFMTETSKRLDRMEAAMGRLTGAADACMAEVLTSRRERLLRDKTFNDQQAVLTDHELRLTRLELRAERA